MPSMPLIQQTQPLPQPIGRCPSLARKLAVPGALLIGGSLIALISCLAGGIFGMIATLALNLGLALYLRDRWITRLLAVAITALILAISLSILFPATMPFALPLAGFVIAYSVTFASIQALKKGVKCA